ncbi:bacitracin ABC transporter ATP-binding protein [Bacillus toyonensis]|uniref:ATP-binding cassette domain-containing protein n=1 Tax=Bacillus toyonensis TaxID=155322 RepID=UPI000BF99A60|nr:ATP-binding cassette domain-containing protein [Bacillus toyonensis]PEP90434.1 bacitracin ABC transporter ATP-binding protein [Bacillus toyonensis]PHC31084.1 bacitracin ABC transporter ATP-binding protein [Bacillus toyonensis]PHC47685.1 bacitracin ABC transporter ATP-binding protein [Bacillus toyonensis]
MDYALETSDLTKIYNSTKIVDSVSLHLTKGEIYGLLGKNGAGKTTIIRMIMGLLKPTHGDIYIFGNKLNSNAPSIFSRIGCMIEYPGFYANLNAIDNLKISCNYMGVTDSKAIERALESVNLQFSQKKKVKNYSLGMKQRLGIARSLLHDPDLLLLDEPTNGLDPAGIIEIRKLLIQLATEQQKTILISSHILSEIQQLVNSIGIINEGVMLEEIHMHDLIDNFKTQVCLKVSEIERCINILKGVIKDLDFQVTSNKIFINNYSGNTADLNKLLVSSGIDVFEIVSVKETLEDYFMNIIEVGR